MGSILLQRWKYFEMWWGEKDRKKAWNIKIHIPESLSYNGKWEGKDIHRERMNVLWMDGNV